MKSYIKVLPLPFWAEKHKSFFNIEKEYLMCVGKEIKPVFNRYGLYLDRKEKKCWVESPFGCHEYPKGYNQFMYDLTILNHRPLSSTTQMAILTLIKEKIISKNLRKLWNIDREWWSLHKTGLNAGKVKIRLKKFKKGHNIQ